jgi:hypothetical protein
MTSPITLIIDGAPVAKDRPRLARRGHVYTPAHTRRFEAHGDTKCRRQGSRLELAQFQFLPDGSGLKVCLPGRTTALARLVPDEIYAGMWRVVRPGGGGLTDMVNKTRAKDIAFGLAEKAIYLRLPPQFEPAKNGHFFEGSAPPVRQTGRAGT